MVRKIGSGSKIKRAKVGGVKKRSTRRRRSRMSGIGGSKSDLMTIGMNLLAVGIGAIVAREGNSLVMQSDPTLDPTVSGLAQTGLGAALVYFVDEPIVKMVGYGMAANGLMVAAVSNISQLQGAPTSRVVYRSTAKRMNGANYNTIAGNGYSVSRLGAPQYNTIAGTAPRMLNGKKQRRVTKRPFSIVAGI